MASIDTLCPECGARLLLRPAEEPPRCPGCGRLFPARRPAPAPGGALQECAVCGGEAFYIQKDFNQNLGCLIFLVGAALAPWTHYLSLLAGTAIDLLLYLLLPTASVCYTCRSIYRGYPRHPAHAAYDPNTAWAHRPRAGPWAQPELGRPRARGREPGAGA